MNVVICVGGRELYSTVHVMMVMTTIGFPLILRGKSERWWGPEEEPMLFLLPELESAI
jgi:hypothetical protein